MASASAPSVPGCAGEPVVGELGVVRVVGRHHDGLLALVARLGHEVRVGGARHGDVGAPHHQVGGVPPVGRLGDVGLVAPDLRRRRRQVGVPVVEAGEHPAHQREEAGARRVGGHGHGRDRREADHPVGAPAADRVDVGGGDHVGHLVPGGADQAALAALGGVGGARGGVVDDRGPGLDRVSRLCERGPVALQQGPAHVGVADPQRRVDVPRERGPPGTPAGLVVRHVGAVLGVVGLLGLPGHDALLDVDLPGARAGAVDAVGRADDAVVLPAVPVGRLPVPCAPAVQGAPAPIGACRRAAEEAGGGNGHRNAASGGVGAADARPAPGAHHPGRHRETRCRPRAAVCGERAGDACVEGEAWRRFGSMPQLYC